MQKGKNRPIRVLYSYPHKIGADRICYTAWQMVKSLADANVDVLLFPGVLHKPLPSNVKVRPTLAMGKFRIPYKLIGRMRALALHDYIVAHRLKNMAEEVDIVHTWPLGSLLTLITAKKLGIPTVLERPNAHTRFAYEVVQKECESLGIRMPKGHEHAYNEDILKKEEAEFYLADGLLCPSEFVERTFIEKGFPAEKLARHQYGFDENIYFPDENYKNINRGLKVIFVGGCAPRKGLHYALKAWIDSKASSDGTFYIAGEFIPGYAEALFSLLSHPSIHVLGHRKDVSELMRKCDILILPSIEEGSALVTYEARGSGCVLLVSDAAGAICKHMENALVHRAGDVSSLSQHISMLYEDRNLLGNLRLNSISSIGEITWSAAGEKLKNVYNKALLDRSHLKIN